MSLSTPQRWSVLITYLRDSSFRMILAAFLNCSALASELPPNFTTFFIFLCNPRIWWYDRASVLHGRVDRLFPYICFFRLYLSYIIFSSSAMEYLDEIRCHSFQALQRLRHSPDGGSLISAALDAGCIIYLTIRRNYTWDLGRSFFEGSAGLILAASPVCRRLRKYNPDYAPPHTFDGGIFSYQVKCIKPDEKIYRILMERYSIRPGDATFYDELFLILVVHRCKIIAPIQHIRNFGISRRGYFWRRDFFLSGQMH